MSADPESDAFVRAFVAIEISPDVREALATLLTHLKGSGAHVAWVPAQNIHLSLVFLGNTPRYMLEIIGLALDEAACEAAPFCFDVTGVGFFGSRRSPRVLWAGVVDCSTLIALQERVANALRMLGIELDGRKYVPHLTLGRVRSPLGCDGLLNAVAEAEEMPFGRVRAESVVLMRSRLLPAGAEYDVLHRAALR